MDLFKMFGSGQNAGSLMPQMRANAAMRAGQGGLMPGGPMAGAPMPQPPMVPPGMGEFGRRDKMDAGIGPTPFDWKGLAGALGGVGANMSAAGAQQNRPAPAAPQQFLNNPAATQQTLQMIMQNLQRGRGY